MHAIKVVHACRYYESSQVQSSAGQHASWSTRRNAAFSKNLNQPSAKTLAASPLLCSRGVARRRIEPIDRRESRPLLLLLGQPDIRPKSQGNAGKCSCSSLPVVFLLVLVLVLGERFST